MEKDKKLNKIHKDRLKRYKEKLEYSKKLLIYLKEWKKNVGEYDFSVKLDLREQFSIYHAFQMISEITADLIAMAVKDLSIVPKNDYTNIDVLEEKHLLFLTI